MPDAPRRAAQSGLYGALLARRGFTGIMDVFENPYGGFCTTFSRSTDRFDMAKLTAGLGEQFETTCIALKFHSCVGSNHTTLDAIRNMQARRAFGAANVAAIQVQGSRVTVDHVGWRYAPQGLTSAQLNLPYCVATFLLEGDAFVEQFTEDKVADPDRIALSRLVEVVEDPAITALGSVYRHMVHVKVTLRDGTVLEDTVEAPRGSEHSFAPAEQVIAKFRKLTAHRLDADHAERIIEQVMHSERMTDARALVQLLAVEG